MKEKELATFSDETRTVLERLIRKGCIEIKENNKIAVSEEMAELLLILDRANVFN